ncbi:MAG: hypothetical protein ACK5T0_08680 [Vampirovibrionales bacterium]
MRPTLKSRLSHKQYGFNLIEVALALTFFGISFSALLLGVQSIISANLEASQVHAENTAANEVLNGVDFYRLDTEARYDISPVRQQIIIATNGDPDNSKRLFYDLNVYSEPNYPDIKIADLTLYKRLNTNQVYRRFQRKLNLNTECHNYGATAVIRYNGMPCIPVPAATAVTYANVAATTSAANRAFSSATAYTGGGGSMPVQQTNLNLYNPENDNVWGGIVTPTAIDVAGMFDYDAVGAVGGGGVLPVSLNPLFNTGLVFNSANRESATGPYPNANARLVMPVSSNTINTTINNSVFRYSLEFGVFLTSANAILRVYPIASNVNELTNNIGYLEYRAENANRQLSVRIDNLRPSHDDVTDRPIVGVALLVLNQAVGTTTGGVTTPGAITQNSENVVVTHMIKRPYTET